MIKYMSIDGFRILKNVDLDVESQRVVLIGDNGHGKTSVLESIYFALTQQTLRSQRMSEVIGDEKQLARVKLTWDQQQGSTESRLIRQEGTNRCRREFYQDGIKLPFARRAFKQPASFFSPTDIHLFYGSPGRRRQFLDQIVGQVFSLYSSNLRKYEKVIKERNAVLKQWLELGSVNTTLLQLYSEKMIDLAYQIWWDRIRIWRNIKRTFASTMQSYFAGKLPFSFFPQLRYQSAVLFEQKEQINKEKVRSSVLQLAEEQLIREKRIGRTSWGPHLDDFQVRRGEENFAHLASRGEMRSMTIALKRAEMTLLEEQIEHRPIVLLDDILSELDEQNRRSTEELLTKYQTFLTSTELNDFSSELVRGAQIVRMEAGEVRDMVAQ